MTTIREATFALLRRHGMTTIFGNPGSNELLFLDDLPSDFRYVMGLHEGAVMAMADGYAQATGRPALVNLHSAAGVGTSMGVLTNTVYAKSPTVVLSGQQIRDTVGQEVMVSNPGAADLPRPLSKWSAEPLSPRDVVRTLAQAIHTANLSPKGPVHVSVPYDDWQLEAGPNDDFTIARSVTDATAMAEAPFRDLVRALDASSHPVLVFGPEVDATGANRDAVRLAEQLGAAVWIAPSPPRCPFPTKHPLFQGVLPANVASIQSLLASADLVLVVGAPVFRYHHHHPGRYLNEGTRLIHLTQDPSEANRAPFGDAMLAPIASTVQRLADSVARHERTAPAREVRAAGTDREGRMHPDTVFRVVSEVAPHDAVHVTESTSTSDSYWCSADLREQGSFYSASAGALGFGLPGAVGIQLADPTRRVVALIGDGSANFGITGLWSAARYRAPVVYVILRNESYGALVNFSQRLETRRPLDFDLPGIDFVRLAEGYGVAGERVTSETELRQALTRAFESNAPILIEALTYHG